MNLVLICFVAVSCAGTAPPAKRGSEIERQHAPLELAPSAARHLDARLLERIRSSPAGYFRFINVAFHNEVCRHFRADPEAMRTVNLHGDAHFEQYAITETGRGLTDFDDASSGPAVLDLVRFSTSIVLTCRQRAWNTAIDAALDRFQSGYRRALQDPKLSVPEPRIVSRVRATFRFDPASYFGWLRSVSEPVPADMQAATAAALEPYIDAMLSDDRSLERGYFRIQELGRTRIGIGSAQLQKFLLRIRGVTDSPEDDDVLELKEMGDLTGVACLSNSAVVDPTRLIVAQARIAYEPYRLAGYIVLDGKYFWVHAWARSYQELEPDDLLSEQELLEIAFDVGAQLGLGHPKYIASPYDRELRQSLLRLLVDHDQELKDLSKSMAGEVMAAWRRFRSGGEGRAE